MPVTPKTRSATPDTQHQLVARAMSSQDTLLDVVLAIIAVLACIAVIFLVWYMRRQRRAPAQAQLPIVNPFVEISSTTKTDPLRSPPPIYAKPLPPVPDVESEKSEPRRQFPIQPIRGRSSPERKPRESNSSRRSSRHRSISSRRESISSGVSAVTATTMSTAVIERGQRVSNIGNPNLSIYDRPRIVGKRSNKRKSRSASQSSKKKKPRLPSLPALPALPTPHQLFFVDPSSPEYRKVGISSPEPAFVNRQRERKQRRIAFPKPPPPSAAIDDYDSMHLTVPRMDNVHLHTGKRESQLTNLTSVTAATYADSVRPAPGPLVVHGSQVIPDRRPDSVIPFFPEGM